MNTIFFTVDRANKALIFVKPLAIDLMEKWKKVTAIKDECDALLTNHMANSPLLSTKEEELDVLLEQIENAIENLKLVGCEFKGFDEGIIDFPARINTRMIHLCWKLDEPEVLYWHEIFEDIGERKKINDELIALIVQTEKYNIINK